MKTLAHEVQRRRFEVLTVLTLTRTGFINSRRIEEWLKATVGDVNIEELRIPFACVAVDIDTGEEVVIKSGPVWEAVRASSSIPAVFALKPWQGRYLVDGGVRNPVPVSIVKEMGADIVIAVNVMRNAVRARHDKLKRPRIPNVFTVAMNSIYISNYYIAEFSLRGADIVIEPDLEGIAYGDFQKAEVCIEKGREAAQRALTEINGKLNASRQLC
jgi:NTE family protein